MFIEENVIHNDWWITNIHKSIIGLTAHGEYASFGQTLDSFYQQDCEICVDNVFHFSHRRGRGLKEERGEGI